MLRLKVQRKLPNIAERIRSNNSQSISESISRGSLSASVSTWETYPVLLDQARDTIEIEFDIVPGREGQEPFLDQKAAPNWPVPRSNAQTRPAR